jgi:hypothetical protein
LPDAGCRMPTGGTNERCHSSSLLSPASVGCQARRNTPSNAQEIFGERGHTRIDFRTVWAGLCGIRTVTDFGLRPKAFLGRHFLGRCRLRRRCPRLR